MSILATLQDVARQAGVSVATAGRALGGYGKVSAATRARVLAAAKQLNYHANVMARSMKQRSSRTIGVIVGNVCNPFFGTILRAIETTVLRAEYKLIVCNTDEILQRELDHAKALLELRVAGLIVSPTASVDGGPSPSRKEIYESRIPTVFIDRALKNYQVPTVTSDNVAAAYEATTHLIERGHRRIGVVVGRKALDSMTRRVGGYRQSLSEHNLEFDETLVVDGIDVGVSGGYAATTKLLGLKSRPTALIVMNNLLALGALHAIRDKGLSIPKDVALVGWDDFDAAPHLQSPLTLVDQSAYTMGSIAAEQLLKMLAHVPLDPGLLVVLKSRLIVRESSARKLPQRQLRTRV